MYQTALLSVDLDRGAEVLRVLDQAGLRLDVALWLSTSEHEDWRLGVSGRNLDALGILDAYGLISETLERAGFPLSKKPAVMIFSMKDPFIRHLRRIFGKAKSVEGMRLGGQVIGDRFIQDGYVYRIS